MKNDDQRVYYPVLDEAIAAYMRRSGLNQAEFAQKMGMAPNTFSWKRRGVREFSLSEATKICDITGISLADAISRVEPVDPDERKTVA